MNKFFVSLAFDDGWKSAIEHAYPILQHFGVPATFYIVSKFVGDREYPQYMNVYDLRALELHGHEIGSHTRSHLHLPELSESEIWEEINGGAEDLRKLGLEPRTFAYPYGEWNPYVAKQTREAGFLASRSIIRGLNNEKTNPYLLESYGVREEQTLQDVTSWIQDTSEKNGWIILCFHQIESAEVLRDKKWIYGTTPTMLERIVRHIVENRIEVLTVENGVQRLLNKSLA